MTTSTHSPEWLRWVGLMLNAYFSIFVSSLTVACGLSMVPSKKISTKKRQVPKITNDFHLMCEKCIADVAYSLLTHVEL